MKCEIKFSLRCSTARPSHRRHGKEIWAKDFEGSQAHFPRISATDPQQRADTCRTPLPWLPSEEPTSEWTGDTGTGRWAHEASKEDAGLRGSGESGPDRRPAREVHSRMNRAMKRTKVHTLLQPLLRHHAGRQLLLLFKYALCVMWNKANESAWYVPVHTYVKYIGSLSRLDCGWELSL